MLRGDMQRNARRIDGHTRQCRRCVADDVRTLQRSRAASDRCMQTGCPRDPRPGRRYCGTCATGRNRFWDGVRTQYTTRSDASISARRATLRPDGTKECRKCGLRQPFSAFSRQRIRSDGLRSECRACDHRGLLTLAAPRWAAADLYECVYCGAPFEHADHIWPSSKGGPDEAWNLVPACASCNSSKGARPVLTFVAEKLGADVVDYVLGPHWTWRVEEYD